jgi:2-methylcitrate dehydratase PrpD
VFQLLGEHRLSDKDIVEVDVGTSELAMRVLAFSEPETPYQAKYSMPYCIAAAVVDHQVRLSSNDSICRTRKRAKAGSAKVHPESRQRRRPDHRRQRNNADRHPARRLGLQTRQPLRARLDSRPIQRKETQDATIREKFNTYRFADYREKVIDLARDDREPANGCYRKCDEESQSLEYIRGFIGDKTDTVSRWPHHRASLSFKEMQQAR